MFDFKFIAYAYKIKALILNHEYFIVTLVKFIHYQCFKKAICN